MNNKEAEELGLKSSRDDLAVKGDKFIKVYANNVQLGVSVWDMNLTFGEIVGVSNGQPIIEQKVKVNMSKEFAKALSNLLSTNVRLYEEKFGEIRIINLDGDVVLGEPEDEEASS